MPLRLRQEIQALLRSGLIASLMSVTGPSERPLCHD
jgi:hypothetical protein